MSLDVKQQSENETKVLEPASSGDHVPEPTLTGWLKEFYQQRIRNSALLFGVSLVKTPF